MHSHEAKYGPDQFAQAIPKLREIQKRIQGTLELADRDASDSIDQIIEMLEKRTAFESIDKKRRFITSVLKYTHNHHDRIPTDLEKWFAGFAITFEYLTQERSRDLIQLLPIAEIQDLQDILGEYVGSAPEHQKQARFDFLSYLFQNNSQKSTVQQELLRRSSKNMTELAMALQHPALESILSIISKYPHIFHYECAFLANIVDGSAKEQFKRTINAQKTSAPMNISIGFKGWIICESGEERLIKSFDEKLAQLIVDQDGNPIMVLKHLKKLTALTVTSFTTPSGFVVPKGTWLSPTSDRLRQLLRESIDKNETHFILKDKGDWALMRGVVEKNVESESQKPIVKADEFWTELEERTWQLTQQPTEKLTADEIALRRKRRERLNEDN